MGEPSEPAAEEESVVEESLPSAKELAAELVAAAYEAEGGQPPSALPEEDFLEAEAAALACPPTAFECCTRVYRRCVYDAVNEALDVLARPPAPPRGQAFIARGRAPPSANSLTSLLAAARERRFSRLGLEETKERVLELVPEPKAAPPPAPPSEDDDDDAIADAAAAADAFAASLPDDIGAATRLVWADLSAEWSDFGEDEWHAAAAASRASSDADALDARGKRAAEIFWSARAELLLSERELHEDVWSAPIPLNEPLMSPRWALDAPLMGP